jgi:hypothetical protein
MLTIDAERGSESCDRKHPISGDLPGSRATGQSGAQNMKFVTRFVAVFLLLLCCATPALAQESKPIENAEFGVTITPPEGWEVTQGNDKAVANFKHKDSQSQIEVVGTKLMTADVADVFFKTFHKTLAESNFEKKEETEATIGEIKGEQTSYKFTHSGVTLEVVIFQFVKNDVAWLVVGYMQDKEKKNYIDDFKSVIEKMTFAEAAAEDGDEKEE